MTNFLRKNILGFVYLMVLPFGISCGCKKSNMDTLVSTTGTKDTALIRFVALGDSYTIGEGAKEPDEAWPTLLANHLAQNGFHIKLLANPSVPDGQPRI